MLVALIAGLNWGKAFYDYGFVNMYMFTTTPVHLFSICTGLFCFPLCGELRPRVFTRSLS